MRWSRTSLLAALLAQAAFAQDLPTTGPGDGSSSDSGTRVTTHDGREYIFDEKSKATTETVPAHPEGEYGGVDLDKPVAEAAPKTTKARSKKKRRAKQLVTWVGFERRADDGARVFLQIDAKEAPVYTQKVAGNELVLTVNGVRLDVHNNARPLDTRFFDTNVARVYAKNAKGKGKRGKKAVEVHVEFKGTGNAVEGSASTETRADGTYLMLDFAPGGGTSVE